MDKRNIKLKPPNFELINKYKVAIKSLQNELRKVKGKKEISNIVNKIIELEKLIRIERIAGCKKLEKKRKLLKNKIEMLSRKLAQAKIDLEVVESEIDTKLQKIDGSDYYEIDNSDSERNDLDNDSYVNSDNNSSSYSSY